MKTYRWICGTVALTLCVLAAGKMVSQQAPANPHEVAVTGAVAGTHDPSIAVDHRKYYVFATGAALPPRPGNSDLPSPAAPQGAVPDANPDKKKLPQLPLRCSDDLRNWTRCGEVFPSILPWIREISPMTEELWAPDISYFDGLFHLYYAFSVFGKNTSGIALATNTTLDSRNPEYRWVDRGLVLRSYETDNFNAIDPNLILDVNGGAWLSFGSFWSGIKMRRLDRRTGLLSKGDMRTYSIASRAKITEPGRRNPDLPPDSEAVEAPFVMWHEGYYYLFVSWDLCCRGLKSTYRTMVGRSRSVTGPYVDKEGHPLEDGGGSPFLKANSIWLGPGGASFLQIDGQDLAVFHAYSATNGKPALQISTLGWKDGWPEAKLAGDN